MEPKARYTLVGATVLAITALIVCAVLWLSDAGSLRHAKHFTIYFQKHALNGLQKDSAVTMRGIKVGSVAGLGISPRNIEQIQVNITLDNDAPVKTDTVALINRNMLTGFASLDLARGTQAAPPLTEVPAGEHYPVIPEAKTELEEIADSLPELIGKVGEISSRVHAALSEENINSFSQSLQNVQQFTDALAKNKDRLDVTFKNIDKAVNEFASISKTLDEFTTKNDARLADVSEQFSKSMKELQRTAVIIRERSNEALTSLSGTSQVLSQQVTTAAQNLNEAAQSAAKTLEGFEQPRNLLTGPNQGSLGPGEKGN